MMKIDDRLIGITGRARNQLDAMGDARRSERARFAEDCIEAWSAAMRDAERQITDAEKIEAFDRLAAEVMCLARTPAAYSGRDGDAPQYLYEAVLQAVLGPRIFTALNEIERLSGEAR
jgi:hypothetical protein